jgi:Spy/CpxP family protein refolding chaperone
MSMATKGVVALVGAAAIALGILATASARSATPNLWKNCTHVHTKYRHGVGRFRARDHTRSGTNPVTNFYRNTRLYNVAMHYNSDLDRDRDGIACEKH